MRHTFIVILLSGCAAFNDPVNHGTEFMKREWAKGRDCGTICDYHTGHMCASLKLSETECRCLDADAKMFNSQHQIPMDAEYMTLTCEPDCKTLAAAIRKKQPWRY